MKMLKAIVFKAGIPCLLLMLLPVHLQLANAATQLTAQGPLAELEGSAASHAEEAQAQAPTVQMAHPARRDEVVTSGADVPQSTPTGTSTAAASKPPTKAPTAPASGLFNSLDDMAQFLRASSLAPRAPVGMPPSKMSRMEGLSNFDQVGWMAPGMGEKALRAEEARTNAAAAANAERVAKERAVNSIDRAKSIWANDSIPSDYRRFQTQKDHVPTKGWDSRKANPAAYAGQDSDTFEDYDNAVNAEDLAERIAKRKLMAEHRSLVYGQGFWKGLAAELLGGHVHGLILFLGLLLALGWWWVKKIRSSR